MSILQKPLLGALFSKVRCTFCHCFIHQFFNRSSIFLKIEPDHVLAAMLAAMHLTLEHITGFEPTEVAVPTAPIHVDGNGGIKGKRPSKKDKLRAAAAAQSNVAT